MNIPTQAPKGGAMSPLNGEFYAGGQFMANQFDMPKGYKKLLKVVSARCEAKQLNIAEIRVAGGQVKTRDAGSVVEKSVFKGSHEQCVTFAQELMYRRSAWYAANGLAAHPTKVSLG